MSLPQEHLFILDPSAELPFDTFIGNCLEYWEEKILPLANKLLSNVENYLLKNAIDKSLLDTSIADYEREVNYFFQTVDEYIRKTQYNLTPMQKRQLKEFWLSCQNDFVLNQFVLQRSYKAVSEDKEISQQKKDKINTPLKLSKNYKNKKSLWTKEWVESIDKEAFILRELVFAIKKGERVEFRKASAAMDTYENSVKKLLIDIKTYIENTRLSNRELDDLNVLYNGIRTQFLQDSSYFSAKLDRVRLLEIPVSGFANSEILVTSNSSEFSAVCEHYIKFPIRFNKGSFINIFRERLVKLEGELWDHLTSFKAGEHVTEQELEILLTAYQVAMACFRNDVYGRFYQTYRCFNHEELDFLTTFIDATLKEEQQLIVRCKNHWQMTKSLKNENPTAVSCAKDSVHLSKKRQHCEEDDSNKRLRIIERNATFGFFSAANNNTSNASESEVISIYLK